MPREREHERDRDDPTVWSATSSDGMVATGHYLATAAGAELLARGGNAIDAAMAASLALGVCEPAGSGLGGMGMMVLHLGAVGRTTGVESPCRAPALATPEEVARSHRYRGYRAIAVPGLPRLLGDVLAAHGTKSPAEVITPALRLAESGVAITGLQSQLLAQYAGALRNRSAGRVFLDGDGEPWAAGTLLVQPALARTLRRLADAGFEDFYDGEIAAKIAADVEAHGGFVRREDLQRLPPARESTPLAAPFDGGTAYTLGPPAGGTALAQLLCMLAALPGRTLDVDSPGDIPLLAGLIQRARADRRRMSQRMAADHLGDAGKLLDPAYASTAVAEVRAARRGPGETSHLSVMDARGNAVALTQSIERSFGSAELGADLGFVYNGYLRAFKVEARQHPHYLRPGAAARSNASPTVIVREGSPWIAIGSTGSERMASGMFETLLRLRTTSPFAAVHAPRLHCTPEGVVLYEDRFSAACVSALRDAGFTLQRLDPYSFKMGGLQLVVRHDGELTGVAEPRRDGAASGP